MVPVEGLIRATFAALNTVAHKYVPSYASDAMFEFDNEAVHETVAVDMSIAVTVFDPVAETYNKPLAMMAVPGFDPTGIDDPTTVPVDGLNR